ncbi:MAG TPA: single-stranded DNA-binding protein [Anaerolineales bacterium]|nr:single-stranded DNA-binding protein [Anaerolineales bacterium]
MSRDLNKVTLIGRLGRDPEMRYTNAGKPVTTFSVASGRTWTTTDGASRSETEWFNVVAWGGLAEVCSKYLDKGQRVYIEGRLQTRRWTDTDGVKKSAVEVVANEMIMLDKSSHRGTDVDEDDERAYEDDLPGEEEDYPF